MLFYLLTELGNARAHTHTHTLLITFT